MAGSVNQYTTAGTASPVHDLDGNLTDDGTFKYIYDGENRLIEVIPKSVATNNYRLRHKFDWLGRRVERILEQWNGSAGAAYSTRFSVWDGWNEAAIYYTASGYTKAKMYTYTWGLDASGSLQGAGGVGGLLAQRRHISSGYQWVAYPLYDGNGNIWQYLREGGTMEGWFEYDPYGNQIASGGTKQIAFIYRFSTKPYEDQNLKGSAGPKLVNYQLRNYRPSWGRWLNRDPIGEQGGLNLYGFVGNDGVNGWDGLGLLDLHGVGPGAGFDIATGQGYIGLAGVLNENERRALKKSRGGVILSNLAYSWTFNTCDGAYSFTGSLSGYFEDRFRLSGTGDFIPRDERNIIPFTRGGDTQFIGAYFVPIQPNLPQLQIASDQYPELSRQLQRSVRNNELLDTRDSCGTIVVDWSYKIFDSSIDTPEFDGEHIIPPAFWPEGGHDKRFSPDPPEAWGKAPVSSGSIRFTIGWNTCGNDYQVAIVSSEAIPHSDPPLERGGREGVHGRYPGVEWFPLR